MSMDNLQENMALLSMIEEEDDSNADGVDFAWWGDERLISFAMDFDKVKVLTEDNSAALSFELARRLEDYITGEADED